MLAFLLCVSVQHSSDAVVIPGADVPQLLGLAPERIVGFRFEGRWEQIPVQVDERVELAFAQVLGQAVPTQTSIFYADPATHTGPDVDPAFDADLTVERMP